MIVPVPDNACKNTAKTAKSDFFFVLVHHETITRKGKLQKKFSRSVGASSSERARPNGLLLDFTGAGYNTDYRSKRKWFQKVHEK